MLDLLIKNATVLDGTGKEGFIADVAIANGKIAAVGKCDGEAARVIDATGLVLTPGFIDSHSHSDRAMRTYPDQLEKIEQGITFSITGQCGGSAAPSRDQETGEVELASTFLAEMEKTPQGSGAKLLIGHGTLRRVVIGTENRAPTPADMEEMKALLRDALEAGAAGLSFGLIYAPGCYAETDECVELAKVVAEYDGLLAAHIRNEGDTLLEAVEEFLTIIKTSGCKRAVFSHHKSSGKQNWGKVKKSLAMIDAAVAEGYEIYADAYPYTASGTTLSATFLPKEFHFEGMTNSLQLLDGGEREAALRAWAKERWGNDYSWVLPYRMPGHDDYAGLNINEIADLRGQTDRMDTIFDLIRETSKKLSGCFFTMREEDVEYVLAHPRVMVCTDSSVACGKDRFHPRLRASFPRVLGKYVREQKVTTLPEMIRKMTSLPAKVYRLEGKGEIKEGFDADICVFDADKIKDGNDFFNPTLKNEGLSFVIVDGKVVVEDGVYNGTRAARVVTEKR